MIVPDQLRLLMKGKCIDIFNKYFNISHLLSISISYLLLLYAWRYNIVTWHLLGHAIKSVTCFDLQFWRSTRPMTSFCIFIAYINAGNSFQRQNYKIRLKQRSLNWINSMQVKKIVFTNVFFSWSLCLLNMFPSMVFPKHFYFSGLLT